MELFFFWGGGGCGQKLEKIVRSSVLNLEDRFDFKKMELDGGRMIQGLRSGEKVARYHT